MICGFSWAVALMVDNTPWAGIFANERIDIHRRRDFAAHEDKSFMHD